MFFAGELTELCLYANKDRDTQWEIEMLDANGDQIALNSFNVLRLTIGSFLDLRSDVRTSGESYLTLTNPTRVVIRKADLCFSEGVHDAELWLQDVKDGTGKATIQKGTFVLRSSLGC